jgi:transposase-like protein
LSGIVSFRQFRSQGHASDRLCRQEIAFTANKGRSKPTILPCAGDKWHLDGVAIKIAGKKHWLWRAVDQDGVVLDILVQCRRDKRAVKRLLQKLLKKQRRPPRVLITDKLASYGAAKGEMMPRSSTESTRA